MSCTTSEALDRNFLVFVKEIERNYSLLQKQQRIRVHQWLDKLVESGGGSVAWKKQRNIYAKVLTRMSYARCLHEPFHSLPPDGPLPTFPAHILTTIVTPKTVSRGGDRDNTAEVTFWKDLYQKIGERKPWDITEQEITVGGGNDVNASMSLNRSSRHVSYAADGSVYDHTTDSRASSFRGRSRSPLKAMTPKRTFSNEPFSSGTDGESTSGSARASVDTWAGSRRKAMNDSEDVKSLKMFIAEQGSRIEVLEIQLQEERLQYDIQIQRLQAAHRTELSSMTASMIKNSSGNRGVDSSGFGDSSLRMQGMQSFLSTPQGQQGGLGGDQSFSYATTAAGGGGGAGHSFRPSSLGGGGGGGSVNGSFAAGNNPSGFSTTQGAYSSSSHHAVGAYSGAAQEQGLYGPADLSSAAYNPMNTTTAAGSNKRISESFLDQQSESDDAFLSYLDKFQTELRSIRALSPPRLRLAPKNDSSHFNDV